MRRNLRAALLAPLAALASFGLVATLTTVIAKADTATISNNTLRDGWYSTQSALTPQSVAPGGRFRQLFSATVSGQVYGQPLVSKNTLLVTTENNNIYGLDSQTGAQQWTRNLGTPWVPANYSKTQYCTDITPNVGVTATPVVDTAKGIMYLTSKTYLSDGTTAVWYLHAVSVKTGAEKPGFPVQISGTADNNPSDTFNPALQLQRPGLLLTKGVIYAAFGAHCDDKPYEGWVFGVSTAGTITARWSDEAAASPTDPLGPGGGIWGAGGGLLSDAAGQMVLATGNGVTPANPAPGSQPPANLAQSVVRLVAQSNGSLKATDFFTPYNAASLNQQDTDLGSGAPVELPAKYFGTTAHPNIIVEVGKEGLIYLLDAHHLGGFQQGASGSDDVINTLTGSPIWGHPAVWPGDGGWVYFTTAQGGGGNGTLRAWQYGLDASGKPTLSMLGRAADSFGFASSSPSVTSNGTTSGSSLLWVVFAPDVTGNNAMLRAYNPIPVNGTLQVVNSFPIGTSTKFDPPSVSNDVVYVGTNDGHVLGFGLAPATAPAFTADSPPPSATASQSYSYTFQASGNPAPTYSVSSGALPPGLALDSSTGVLSGTPTNVGSYTFRVEATNGVGSPAQTPSLTITVNPGPKQAPTITSANAGTATVGVGFNFTVTTTGGPTPTVSESGNLPSGITFTPNTNGTGTLSGTPAAGTAGAYKITFTASNGVKPDATQSFTLTVADTSADLNVLLTGPKTATLNTDFVLTLTITNAGPSTADSVQGSVTLPSGVSFVSATDGGTYANGVVSFNWPSVSSGSHVNPKITVSASSAGTLTFSGQGSSATYDPNTGHNSATASVNVS